jgi:hypothetical protein
MAAEVCGLDMTQAMAAVPDGLDIDFVHELFVAAERGFTSAREGLIQNGR